MRSSFFITAFALVATVVASPINLEERTPQRNRNQGGIDPPPGTPADPGIAVPKGTSCTTTSTKGVLGCNTGDGGTFNIVNGKRVG